VAASSLYSSLRGWLSGYGALGTLPAANGPPVLTRARRPRSTEPKVKGEVAGDGWEENSPPQTANGPKEASLHVAKLILLVA
jgi:hypothetical protein